MHFNAAQVRVRSLDVKPEHGVDVGREVGEEDEGGEGVAAVRHDEGDQGDGGEEGAPRHGQFLRLVVCVRFQRSLNPWVRVRLTLSRLGFNLYLFIYVMFVLKVQIRIMLNNLVNIQIDITNH